MTFRFSAQTIIGAAAILALGATAGCSAGHEQGEAALRSPHPDLEGRSHQDAPGEVVRTDTVTVYKTDTLQFTTRVVDTLRLTNTITRVDTVIPTPPPIRLPNGFYAGLAAGFSSPAGALYTPNSAGGTAQAQLGWQNAKQVFGVRLDANGAMARHRIRASRICRVRRKLANFSADGKLQLPFVNHLLGASHRFALYGIGGYTYTMYKNLPMRVDAPDGNENVAFFAPGDG